MNVPIRFASEGYQIQGRFYSTDQEPALSTVLLLPGFPGNEGDVLDLGQEMSQRGVHVMTFNYRGTHQSEGTYSLQGTLEDIRAALEYLAQPEVIRRYHIDTDRLVLGGYSYGGGMALAYAAHHPEVQRVFSIAGTDHGEFARECQRNPAFAQMIGALFKELESPNGPVRSAQAALEELARDPEPYDLRLHATALADRDMLLIGGWDDSNVTLEHHVLPFYRALQGARAQSVQIVAFQDNHAFERNRERLAEAVVCWVKSP